MHQWPVRIFLPLTVTTNITVTVVINITAMLNNITEVVQKTRPDTGIDGIHWLHAATDVHRPAWSPALLKMTMIICCYMLHQRRQDQGNGEQRHSVPHTHSEWAKEAGGYVPILYEGILYQIKHGAGNWGITAENVKSHSILISTKIRLIKALV